MTTELNRVTHCPLLTECDPGAAEFNARFKTGNAEAHFLTFVDVRAKFQWRRDGANFDEKVENQIEGTQKTEVWGKSDS